uniref:FRUITFULL-like protein n=1 Tax=Akebia trifoliata TaxID=155132 RepID=Q6GWV1_9MAGN|nr:FRUITFULL-like protein [Akebia trifoliata]
MGRGRVQLKRIENKINRQVTFSKRRSGLLKKAYEISVLCDVEVACIVFSDKGRLYEFSTESRMERILERYERCSLAAEEIATIDPQSQGSLPLESRRLKARLDVLQKTQRRFMGEDLDSMSIKEIQNLEQQLDASLKQIRLRKNQLMYESICELQKKETALQEQNNQLGKKIKEKEKTLTQQVNWEQPNQGQNSPAFLQSQTLVSLNIGGPYQARSGEEEERVQSHTQPSTVLPPWMLGHVN